MQNIFIKNSWSMYLILFIVSISIGCNIDTQSNLSLINVDNNRVANWGFFQKILINNLLLALSLVIGFISFNIYNVVLIFQNGLIWGYNLNYYSMNGKSLDICTLLLPHISFEVFFIIWASHYSTLLSYQFFVFVRSSFEDKSFFNLLFSKGHMVIYVAVLIGALVETFLSFSIYSIF